jgi:ectoine hydroxylase-related dioxygenase (phytanoyl-CoA dioxygenase family)
MGILNRISTTRIIRRAHRLQQQGDVNGALEYLFAANRNRENPSVERAIVDLLLQSPGTDGCEVAPRLASPVTANGTLQIVGGEIPEICASEFSAAALQEAISRTGYLIVRGLFKAVDISVIKSCIDEALNARADSEDSPLLAENPWYYHSPHFPGDHAAYSRRNSAKKFTRTGSFKVIDSPRGVFKVLELYRNYRLREVVDEFFGEASVIAARKWVFRLVEPIKDYGGGIGGGWHQDGQFMGEGIRALNMWIALSHCGEGTDAPGITLIPKRISEIVEFGTRGAKLNWVVGGELVAELARDVTIVSPTFAAGDALFFDHYSLHRSGHEIGQSRNRYALESWFYAKSAHAANSVIPYL